MARDRPPDSGSARDSPIPEDEDLPLLYPDDEQDAADDPVEEVYDPFAEDTWSNSRAEPSNRDRGTADSQDASPEAGPPSPARRSGPAGRSAGQEGEKLNRLLDIPGTESSGTQQRSAGPNPSASGGRVPRPTVPPQPGPAEPPTGGSVFEPAGGQAGTPPAAGRTAGAGRAKRPRPRARPAPQRHEQPAESVFQPRATADRSEQSRPVDELPEDPRDLPKVKPKYERGREAGPVGITLAIIVAVGLLTMLAGSAVGSLIMLAGSAWFVYRMCLILPHPVRVTPEQAVREFYEAFCHLVPNFRRMYLLLSVPAKRDKQVSSYRAFRAYWRWRQAQVVGKSWFETVGFELERFETKYNSQRTFAAVDFTLLLYRRGHSNDPVLVRPVSTTLVKGRDGSWYLNEGVLP